MELKQLRELSDLEVRMGFAASCIETAARRVGCSYAEMYRRMKRVELLNDYILRHYSVIHAEGRDTIIDRILETLEYCEATQGISGEEGMKRYLQKEQQREEYLRQAMEEHQRQFEEQRQPQKGGTP